MQVITPEFVKNKRVLLRSDIDVLIEGGSLEEFRLSAGLPTLRICLEYGSSVTMMGHIGRPGGQVVEKLRVAPVIDWFKSQGFSEDLENGKLQILENLRFDPREEACDEQYAKELAGMGEVYPAKQSKLVYINEAFAAHNPAVSTTILPTILPHTVGFRFAQEVKMLSGVRANPKKPLVIIMGGLKVEDKLPFIKVMAQIADAVLVGGKIASELTKNPTIVGKNVLVGKLNEEGTDMAPETIESWRNLIMRARMIIWNGPLGRFEDPKNDATKNVAKIVAESEAETIVGGGDTISALSQAGLLKKFEQKGFVSTGGGAMLKFLAEGTLPTIEVLS